MQEAAHTVGIVAHDLACRRGDRVLFCGLSFELGAGQAMQVSGANGVGKSSLLRLAAGLARPFAGRIAYEGTVGLVDERAALDPELPLARALTFWNRLDGGISSSLEALGLAHLLDVPVRYLSTGQRKRAAMARLLGQDAAIWLLDEPLNGLDVEAAHLIQDLTAAHCATGGVALIASHQLFALPHMTRLALADYAG
jgi:heme exporter protein A